MKRTRDFRFRFGRDAVRRGDVFVRLPLRRSSKVTLFLVGLLLAFAWPLVFAPDFVRFGGDSLFELVFGLFGLFFFAAWSLPVIALLAVILFTVIGHETLHIRGGNIGLRLALGPIGIERRVAAALGSGFRRESPPVDSSVSWRGPHIAFEIEGETVRVGCDISVARAETLVSALEAAARRAPELTESTSAVPEPEVPAVSPPPVLIDDVQLPSTVALTALLAANIVPILGVMFAGWRVGEIMLLYWAESAVIGFYNLFRMWFVGRFAVLAMGPFFLFHYGAFMSVHLLFVYTLFIAGPSEGMVDARVVAGDLLDLWPALLALMVSHGISLVVNFIGRREYEGRTIHEQMTEPYKRIVLMHMTIIVGGFFVIAFGHSLPALLIMIVIKTITDLKAHLDDHAVREST